MKANFYLRISINLIIVFLTVMIMSFLPDYLHEVFGDNFCVGNVEGKDYCEYGWSKYQNPHKNEWHWGYRHWLWVILGALLFLVQGARIMNIIFNESE